MVKLHDIIQGLQTPTPKHGIGFKPRSVNESRQQPGTYAALALPYVEHSWIKQLLDVICTPFGWQSDAKEVAGLLCVGIGILNPDTDEWIWKWDTGHDAPFQEGKSSTSSSMVSSGRGVFSTSFKRAAYQWGIGNDVLNMGTRWVPCEASKQGDKIKFRTWAKDPLPYFGYTPRIVQPEPPAGTATVERKVDQQTGEIISPEVDAAQEIEKIKNKCYSYADAMCEMTLEEATRFIKDYLDKHGESVAAYKIAYNGLVDYRRGRHPSQQ